MEEAVLPPKKDPWFVVGEKQGARLSQEFTKLEVFSVFFSSNAVSHWVCHVTGHLQISKLAWNPKFSSCCLVFSGVA